ncbi:AAA family ATPase [Staphylococcus gallinarum]|uniref:AAA family ATPase n=1 Tax=Staphylococcus gallinarum TaxID=1293 RepID=UPI0030C4BF8A
MPLKLQEQNNPTINIAITGKMRSGKDTVAKNLINLMCEQYKVHAIAFGDSLKYYVKQLFNDEFADDRKPRELYQWFGQTLRMRDEDIWIKQLINSIDKNNSQPVPYNTTIVNIITDLRQPNEYKFCKDNGFYIVKVECDDSIRVKRMNNLSDNFDTNDLTHETESFVDSYEADYTLVTSHINEKECKERVIGLMEFINKNEKEKGEL